MPTPQDFMERVVAWPGPSGPGWVNLHWTKKVQDRDKPVWLGSPHKTVDPLIARAQTLAVAPSKAQDIYFCLSTQAQAGTHAKGFQIAMRDAKYATLLKAIWLDVDVKTPPKGYETLADAVAAVTDFCAKATLPGPSALVASGGGLHVYWISERPLSVQEWEPFAQGLRAEAQRLGLRCDYGVTTDPARVLRVPGTFNRKLPENPRTVKVLGLGADYDFAKDFAHLYNIGSTLVTATVTKAATIPGFDLSGFQKPSAVLLAALRPELETGNGRFTGLDHQYSDLPLDPTLVIKECPAYRNTFRTGGKLDSQPLWNLFVLGSTWFENGREFSHALSDKHPGYGDGTDTDALYDRKVGERAKGGLGWPSCKAFADNGCKLCHACAYRGKITSPLKLAERVAPPEDPTPAVVDPVTAIEITPEYLDLPKGYFLAQDKRIAYQAPAKDDEPSEIQYVFHGNVVSKPYVSGGATPTLHFRYQEGPNFTTVLFPLTEGSSDAATMKCLAAQTVMIDAEKLTRKFMRSWVSQINHAYKMITTHPFGWITDDGKLRGFAYGGKLFKQDGTFEETALPSRSLQENFTPTGDIGPFNAAMEVVSEQGNPALEVLSLQAWASPLLRFNGLYATICWAYSKESGAFKTSAIKTGMAIWCSPGRAKEKTTATVSGMETKLNNLKNIPVFMDEITDETVLDNMLHIVQLVPEGGQGAKSTRSGETRAPKDWSTVMVCGSNTSMHQHQVRRNATSDARAQRVFEIIVPKKEGTRDGTEVERTIKALDDNFGHAGLRYAQYLAMNEAKLSARYMEIDQEMKARINPNNEERFWRATVNQTLLAAECANEVLGKPYYHIDEIKKFLVETYDANRMWVADNVTIEGKTNDSRELMAQVFERFMNNILVTDRLVSGKGDKTKVAALRTPPINSGHGNPVYMQIVQSPAVIRIDWRALRDYLNKDLKRGLGAITSMQRLYGGHRRDGVNLLANCDLPFAKPRVDVWEIEVSESHPLYPQWHAIAFSSHNMGMAATPATATSKAAADQDMAKAAAQAKADMDAVKAAGAAQ